MSLSGAHKSAFRREVTREGRVYAIRDEGGFPAPADAAGNRAVPFWSKPTRAQRVVAHVVAYRELEIVEVAVEDWLSGWMSSLERDGLMVGVNWAGARATGFDMPPAQVVRWFAEPDTQQ
jgi:uncharacterized protein DUF2750